MVFVGPLWGRGLGDLPLPNLSPDSRLILKSKFPGTPHRGHFQAPSARGKQRGTVRVSPGVPTPSGAQSPRVIPGCAGPWGLEMLARSGRPWEEALNVLGGWDSANPHVLERPRGRECSRKSSWDELPPPLSSLGEDGAGESSSAEPLLHPCRGQGRA